MRQHDSASIDVNDYRSGFHQTANACAARAIASKLSGTEWAVWSYLCMVNPYADRSKPGERIYRVLPSVSEIATQIGRSAKAVTKAMKRLEELELYAFRYEFREGYNLTAEAAKGSGSSPRLNTGDYEAFLQSDYWRQVRDWILERDGHTCRNCSSQTRLQVHHLTYEHHGEEHLHPEDLVTLCRSCHEEVHGLSQA